MKILSCGAGMQSSALHLMGCENALAKKRGEPPVWPLVPIYDISIFCDLGLEPPWVKSRSPHGERRLKFNVRRQNLLGAEKIRMILMQREHKVSTRFVADIYA